MYSSQDTIGGIRLTTLCEYKALYGSTKVPKEIFGEELLPLFYETMAQVAPGAMHLLELLRAAWNPDADINTWQLPDGHMAVVPVTETIEKRIHITEIKYTPVVQIEVINPNDYGISLIANVVHSIDAYVLRTLIRRCNYSIRQLREMRELLVNLGYNGIPSDYSRIWEDTKIADMTMLNATKSEVYGFPMPMRHKLVRMIDMCLEHKPFEIICVHDS